VSRTAEGYQAKSITEMRDQVRQLCPLSASDA
jgi:hypothetical protein